MQLSVPSLAQKDYPEFMQPYNLQSVEPLSIAYEVLMVEETDDMSVDSR